MKRLRIICETKSDITYTNKPAIMDGIICPLFWSFILLQNGQTHFIIDWVIYSSDESIMMTDVINICMKTSTSTYNYEWFHIYKTQSTDLVYVDTTSKRFMCSVIFIALTPSREFHSRFSTIENIILKDVS